MNRKKNNHDDFLCHYTSVDVLCKLFTEIKNGHIFFHASSIDFMNDSAEYMAARKHCKDYVDEIIMEYELGIPFALCFSNNEDNIPMWRMYANEGKGVCLKFDYNELSVYFDNLSHDKSTFNQLRISSCRYATENHIMERQKPQVLDKDYPDTKKLKEKMTEDAFVKPIPFKYENEWRLMVWHTWPPTEKGKILFKVKDNELCPYIRIPIPVKCLKQIVVSPHSSDHMIDSVKLLLASYAEGHFINVYKSNITLKV